MTAYICCGRGDCLEQVDFNTTYKKYDHMSCKYNCKPVKCYNFAVCGKMRPEWLLLCNKDMCNSCESGFSHLQIGDEKECPICFETRQSVKQLNCNHTICVDCFKRCHLPPYWNEPQPDFPYPSDIEDEYELHEDGNSRWRSDPAIQKYEENSKKWYNDREERERNEQYLKKCPLCRK
jgi:hypothetical protein